MVGAKDAPDAEITAYASAHDYVVLTNDLDFSAILAGTDGEDPSVVQIRAEDISPDAICRQVISALRQISVELDEGALLTLDPNRTRLRVLPLHRGQREMGGIMQRDELTTTIQAAGGERWALEYADALLEKINRLEAAGGYNILMKQFISAAEPGDFRGRVLEVNFANLFLEKGVRLQYAAKQQGAAGDVDFCWCVSNHQVFIETKLLGQDKQTKEDSNKQLEAEGCYATCISDLISDGTQVLDTRDVARIQRDIFQKSSTKKFNATPEPSWINLVAVDVSELQLGAVDIGDCLLAAMGNELASRHCHLACLRPEIVGVFEKKRQPLTVKQDNWVKCFHNVLGAGEPHPRDYIHGALFLFRDPKERAALSYQLSAAVVWNPALVDAQTATELCKAFHQIVPALC